MDYNKLMRRLLWALRLENVEYFFDEEEGYFIKSGHVLVYGDEPIRSEQEFVRAVEQFLVRATDEGVLQKDVMGRWKRFYRVFLHYGLEGAVSFMEEMRRREDAQLRKISEIENEIARVSKAQALVGEAMKLILSSKMPPEDKEILRVALKAVITKLEAYKEQVAGGRVGSPGSDRAAGGREEGENEAKKRRRRVRKARS